MSVKSFTISDIELASYVKEWGQIEEVKEVLLAKSELFSGEHTLILNNTSGVFSFSKTGSFLYKRSPVRLLGNLTLDGAQLFAGRVHSVKLNRDDRTAAIRLENYLTDATAAKVTRTGTNINPAVLMLALLEEEAGLASVVDRQSFIAAGAGAAAAGAVVNCSFDGSTSVLAALQKIQELASISVYIHGGLIRARAFRPYQGNGAGLRQLLSPSNVRSFGDLVEATDNLKNVVKVPFGADSSITLRDEESIKKNNGLESDFDFNTDDGSELYLTEAYSAEYFGLLFLARAAKLKRTIELKCNNTVFGVQIGDRHPITDAESGLDEEPFEVIETHKDLDTDGVSLLLASLS